MTDRLREETRDAGSTTITRVVYGDDPVAAPCAIDTKCQYGKVEDLLETLLAYIHRDGGHHTIKVGLDASVSRAIFEIGKLHGHSDMLGEANNLVQELQTELNAMRKELLDREQTIARFQRAR